MKTIDDIITKTATQWCKRDRKYRKLINIKNKLILRWWHTTGRWKNKNMSL